MRCATWSLIRMDQISLALRGGLGPISLPWFQGAVVRQGWSEIMSCIAVLRKQSPTTNLGCSADETQTGHSPESLRQLIKVSRTSRFVHRYTARDPELTLAVPTSFGS